VADVGEKPDGRDGHSATVVNDCMYVFGGFVQRVKRFSNDIYEFNFLTSTWTLIVPKVKIIKMIFFSIQQYTMQKQSFKRKDIIKKSMVQDGLEMIFLKPDERFLAKKVLKITKSNMVYFTVTKKSK
jgi:hypothetical protein